MIRIMLIADGVLLRRALLACLSTEDGLEVVADTSTGGRVAQVARRANPDVAVIDMDGDTAASLATAHAVHTAAPGCKLLVLMAVDEPWRLRPVLEMPVQGYFSKNGEPWQLAAAVRGVANGQRVVDPALAVAAMSLRKSPLTTREVEVLRLAGNGLPLADIAVRLHLAPGTVRNYVSAILRKIRARNRVEAFHVAADAGWL